MATQGEESVIEYVQEVTPFPMAQDLLLLGKDSVPESTLLSMVSTVPTEATVKGGQLLESLVPEQPFAPFLDSKEGGVMPLEITREGQIANGNQETTPVSLDHELQEESYEPLNEGDVSEKKVGEKIALFEGLAILQVEEIEEPMHKRNNSVEGYLGNVESNLNSEGLTDSNNSAVDSEGMPESLTGDVESIEEKGSSEVTNEFASEDTLFEGLTLIESSNDAPETVGVSQNDSEEVSQNDTVDLEVDKQSDRLPEVTESGEVDAAGRLNATESFKDLNAGHIQQLQSVTVPNGTHKVETLGEILMRDRKEKESRESATGAGEETISQGSSDHNAQSVPMHMGSTSKRPQVNGDAASLSIGRPPPATSDCSEVLSHRLSTSGTNIVGDILYNIAVGDEEGRSRQRILAFAAKRYAANVERNPEDHDALYNWALVLQESADNAGPDMGPPGKDALLEEACKKYEAATQLCPTLHEAYYNWAIAISDRAKIRGRTKEAEDLWKQACDRYEWAVQLNWNSPQALNNWGLALQELGAIVAMKEKRAIVKKAIRKFRAAIRLRFDFHRAVYNLGTVLYGLAEDISRSGRRLSTKEPTPTELNSLSAIYITAAHALKPDYPVYQGALRLVRIFLPLPYLRAGWLRIPPKGDSLAPHSDWLRLWFVLDHEALYEVEKLDRKSLAHSYSSRSSTVNAESGSSGSSLSRVSALRIEMEDIMCLAPSADLSLPSGGGFCIDTESGPQYLIADTWEGMDAWVDAIRLVYTIYAQGKRDVLAGVLAGG